MVELFNIQARANFKRAVRARMPVGEWSEGAGGEEPNSYLLRIGIWEAMTKLDTVLDDSDPDVSKL